MSGKDMETALTRLEGDPRLDDYLTEVCLSKTMGDVVRNRETASIARAWAINGMVFNAVFEQDVDLIKTIATRIDGTVPDEGKREGYANLLGDAIDDVLSYDSADMLKVYPEDPPVVAMAKVLVHVSTQPAGGNYAKRKERNLAASMILERTGGRKVEPTRPLLETKYVEPDWMRNGEDEQEQGQGGRA